MLRRLPPALAMAAVVPVLALLAQAPPVRPVKRAQPPTFSQTGVFYEDAFRDGLVGERPANLGQPAAPAASATASAAPAVPGGDASSPPAGSGWSALISAATIEDVVKALKQQVDQAITTPSDFAGKGHKLARRELSVLAVLFAVAGEYDGDVRWKRDAPAARDTFARSAANFKVGTPQAYQEAKLRKDELGDLVGGSSPFAGKEAETKANWGQIANRGPLMQYLDWLWEPRLKPALADKGQFAGGAEKVLRDAEVIAALAEVLAKEGMPDADSDEYREFCTQLRDGAKAIRDAVRTKNYDQASSASAAIGKACNQCHENYRS
jgi:hypothetical protein